MSDLQGFKCKLKAENDEIKKNKLSEIFNQLIILIFWSCNKTLQLFKTILSNMKFQISHVTNEGLKIPIS